MFWNKTTKNRPKMGRFFVVYLAVPMGFEPAMQSIRITKDDIVEKCCLCYKAFQMLPLVATQTLQAL